MSLGGSGNRRRRLSEGVIPREWQSSEAIANESRNLGGPLKTPHCSRPDRAPYRLRPRHIGGVKRGFVYGETDDLGYRPVQGRVHLHDLHATLLHLLGIDHERLTYPHHGRQYRLTDVYGRVVTDVLA